VLALRLRRPVAYLSGGGLGSPALGDHLRELLGLHGEGGVGPPSERRSVRCFSIIDAPSAAAATATPMPMV
jgi:hypothetical protein